MKQDVLTIKSTPETIAAAAQALWQFGKDCRVWAFYGDMGAGKTTLIGAVCREMGTSDAVSSPTFALINEYRLAGEVHGATAVFHMDWDRLADAGEAIQAGMEDALSRGGYCFIEWPERAPSLLPREHIQVRIDTLSATERFIEAKWVR